VGVVSDRRGLSSRFLCSGELFLDRISSTSSEVSSKLLRTGCLALDDREDRDVGLLSTSIAAVGEEDEEEEEEDM